ncbi:ATP-dependent RNA helicase SUPV3L1 isoform 1 [Tripterygium wilfordii]|uniref:ATP-dependent RNA helicase SUV3L, mitochondrial n=1 Tax=Tripterygium wilfordii TaxID=458696 RepID=A0A7J7CNG4_TRIWF|nr:DExH-box ATP-dependent RNA helicase DExH18, mitochondrial [Tripterygium wilfordii]XP_038725148.1 DExH-box ATP-dependent RNA helicase DExH18, mitochondrial [Tripterygium wilfordii]XP_038725149.1 DExH-box ATP-dependent RNA helicase DExH18, mitochondrial [Tripterygium wilfordii]KAF5735538.1 ATP-dependent RNA helicase SUPV3L1 isoform 1 [Tripterygium wilfordii]
MARGNASSLFRVCTKKINVSRARVLIPNRYLCSFEHPNNWVSGNFKFSLRHDVPKRQFSTSLLDLFRPQFSSRNPKLPESMPVGVSKCSSSIEDDDNVYKSGTSESEIEELEQNNGMDSEGSVGIEEVNGNEMPDEVENFDDNGICGSATIESECRDAGRDRIAQRNPVELYQELRNAENSAKVNPSDWLILKDLFGYFAKSGWAANQALAIYIGMSFFPTAVHKFRAFFLKRFSADIANYLVSLGVTDAAVRFLFPIFVEFCIEEFPDEIKRFRGMIQSADLTKPQTWFPFARAMKRKIIYHCGPTNSGKTYNALQRFMEAKKGIYCSPLRLLAMEVFDKVNALGVYCSLHTGQEVKYVPFSNHVSCTVEMVSTDELYDVAVIDEIQMMADPCRGYAWTRALLGLKADEIHLCGDPSVLNIVRKVCSETGDELCEKHYERFKPLVVEAKTLLGDLRNVRSGDCVVAFSRREIFEVKLTIEKHTKHRCCVIYGALPPETRRQQANLFNNQDNEFDVLVASDAVGMGLNLNIRRVVFYSLSKYNGDRIVPVPESQVKQIAGRAGRRGSLYPDGLTTALHLDDLDYLIECLKQPFDEVRKVGLFPFFEQVELFAGKLPNMTFTQLLEKFGENCRLDGSYFLCRHDHIKKVANMLEKVQGLSLEDRFNFCFAPVNIRDPKAMYHLLRFASSYSRNVPVSIAMGMPKGSAQNDAELLDLETRHQVLSMYMWLSHHFKRETFPFVKKAEIMATDIADLLGQSLLKACWKPESRQTGRSKPQQKKEGNEKPQQKEEGYERPRSLIKLHGKKRQDKASRQEFAEKVAV